MVTLSDLAAEANNEGLKWASSTGSNDGASLGRYDSTSTMRGDMDSSAASGPLDVFNTGYPDMDRVKTACNAFPDEEEIALDEGDKRESLQDSHLMEEDNPQCQGVQLTHPERLNNSGFDDFPDMNPGIESVVMVSDEKEEDPASQDGQSLQTDYDPSNKSCIPETRQRLRAEETYQQEPSKVNDVFIDVDGFDDNIAAEDPILQTTPLLNSSIDSPNTQPDGRTHPSSYYQRGRRLWNRFQRLCEDLCEPISIAWHPFTSPIPPALEVIQI